MSEEVPGPGILDGIGVIFVAFDVDGSHLVEAAELAGSSGAALQPDDEGDCFVGPGEGEPLPERVVDGSLAVGEDVLVAGVGLVVQRLLCLGVVEVGRVRDAGNGGGEKQGQSR